MSDLLLLIRIQARIAAFLADLGIDRLVALAEGRAVLAILDGPEHDTENGPGNDQIELAPAPRAEPAAVATAATRTPAGPRPRESSSARAPFDADSVVAELRACDTIDQGTELLAALHLTAANVKLLAKSLKVPQSGRKDEVTKKILQMTFGSRSKHAALHQR